MTPSSLSDIRHWEGRVVSRRDELERSYNGLTAAVAREFRELHDKCAVLQDKYTRAKDTIAHLQDENSRLRDRNNARLQEDEIIVLRKEITRLERDNKRKRESKQLQMQSAVRRREEINTNITAGLSIEGDNSAGSYAKTTSAVAHHRPAPLNGVSPHKTRSSDGHTNATDDIEVLRSSSDSSSPRESDAYDSWSVSWATDASDTDGMLLQPSPSPDPANLTPHFPFKVFLGTFLDDSDTSTAQTIDFDDLSMDFRQAVVEHTEGWVEEGLENWPSWDHVVNPHNECVYQKASGKGLCYWTVMYPKFCTCMTCANERRMCFKKHGDEVWLLPLPPQVSGNAELGTLGSFVIQHHAEKASTKEHRHVWEKDKGKPSCEKVDQ
ncbi:hypothetical protein KC345_g8004 [Hortaea werneckii]|nr:hypothetical protein KC345_g8004 [Hortaea werneckii]